MIVSVNSPTCPQCDCVVACQSNPELCPNVANPAAVVCFMCHGKGWYYTAHAYPPGMTAPETKIKCTKCAAQPVQPAQSVYFIRMGELRDVHNSTWHEATKDAFDLTPDAWKQILYRQPPAIAQPVQPNNLEAAVFDAWEHYERTGSVCRFEGRSMIYASTLEEIYEAAIALPVEPAATDALWVASVSAELGVACLTDAEARQAGYAPVTQE